MGVVAVDGEFCVIVGVAKSSEIGTNCTQKMQKPMHPSKHIKMMYTPLSWNCTDPDVGQLTEATKMLAGSSNQPKCGPVY